MPNQQFSYPLCSRYLNAQEPTKLTNCTSNSTSFTKKSSTSTNDSTNLTSSISSSDLGLSNSGSSNSNSKNSSLARSPRTSKKRFGSKQRTDSSCNDQATQNAVTQLRHAIDNLEQRQDKLEKQINRADVRAREYKTANNKQAAIQSLKKKKALEQQLQQLDNQITNMEGKLGVLEAAQTNLLVYRNSVTAGESLKRIHKQVSVTEVEDAVFDFEQQTVLADDVGKAIGSFRQVDSGNYDEEEEEDLMAELEALEMEECSPSSIMPTA